MTGMCAPMTPVTVREPARILLTRHPVTTASTVTEPTPAAAGPVPYTREAPAPRRSATPARRQRTAALLLRGRPVPMTGMCAPMTPVTVREPAHIQIIIARVMMAFSAMVPISATEEAVLSMRETPVRGRSATPARRQRTAALPLRGRPVPMTGMCAPMTPVTVREPARILPTRHPVTTASTVTEPTPAAAGPVPCTREAPVRDGVQHLPGGNGQLL